MLDEANHATIRSISLFQDIAAEFGLIWMRQKVESICNMNFIYKYTGKASVEANRHCCKTDKKVSLSTTWVALKTLPNYHPIPDNFAMNS